MEELLYPDKRPVAGWYLSMDDTAIVERQRAGTRYFKDTITDASIMLMRTRIGPDVPPAKKNLAVFLRYA